MFGFKLFNKKKSDPSILYDNAGYSYEIGSEYQSPEELTLSFNLNTRRLFPMIFEYFEFPLDFADSYNDSKICCLIEILGPKIHNHEKNISITNKIKIIKPLTKDELLNYCEDGENKMPSGNLYYCLNKTYHRADDLPAIIRVNGFQAWYQYGKLYRSDDKPVIIKKDGKFTIQEWYNDNGKKHRDNGLPAVIKEADNYIHKEWFYNGKHYRDQNKGVGPTILTIENEQIIREEWINEKGNCHRADDLPAVITINSNKISKSWYNDGVYHRLDDKPAIQVYIDGKISYEAWCVNGKHIKRPDDLPSEIRYCDDKVVYEAWYDDNKLHRSNDLPAMIEIGFNGILEKNWYEHGKIHRLGDMPAITKYNPLTLETDMWWYEGGKIHRSDDKPAIIIMRSEDGTTNHQEWYKNGFLHRSDDLPSIQSTHKSGFINKTWTYKGKLHRLCDLPAIIMMNDNDELVEEWWFNNKIHRDGKKPAIQISKDGKVIESKFYINGKKIEILS
jgi:hypothetical protein